MPLPACAAKSFRGLVSVTSAYRQFFLISACAIALLSPCFVKDLSCNAVAYSTTAPVPVLSAYDVQYHQIWELVNRYFLFKERLANWAAWHHRFDGTLKNARQAEKAIDEMLDSLGDEYTFFRNTELTQERRIEDEERNVVSAKMLKGNIGYIHITTFNARSCVDETKNCLRKLSRAKAIVLDLRENKGGSIDDAFKVFSFFERKGKFVSMTGTVDGVTDKEELILDDSTAVCRKNGIESRFPRERTIVPKRPIVIVVNERTKSAAEMLAGALRDERRAALVGNKTFGKGIVQRVWEFDNGTSVKITSARYYLPNGDAVHGLGIVPHRLVSNASSADSQLVAACSLAKRMTAERSAVDTAQVEGAKVSSSLGVTGESAGF
jgi:C-terminal processing protease CtpA/Prc